MDLQGEACRIWKIEKNKAKFVATRYSQVEGIYYEETFTPVARYCSIKSIISLATQIWWKIHQMDLKIIFLSGVIE